MATLVIVKGPNLGRQYALDKPCVDLGRHASSSICLESQAVSRHHARLLLQGDDLFVEDLNSSNGTYVNGKRIKARTALTEQDTLQIGPYAFAIRVAPAPTPSEDDLPISSSVVANLSDHDLARNDPAHKLQVIMEIAQHLGRTLDTNVLLGKLLEHVLNLFPQAERGLVLLCEGDDYKVRAVRNRREGDNSGAPYSRTIVQRALEEGIGILSEDVRSDDRFSASSTLGALELRSLLCVPLLGGDGKRLGALHLDRFREGKNFQKDDLQLLTLVGMQVAVVLENAALHEKLLGEERLRQEVALAREIQDGFLPAEFPAPAKAGFELYARVLPAREVAGDLYDFFTLADGRLAFFVGDVSGKGMPAALFMVAVRTLGRHLASTGDSPAETLTKLNTALAADNPSGMFVTLVYGLYDPGTGGVVVASAGHLPPLLRRADGTVEVTAVQTGRLLGYDGSNTLGLVDNVLRLAPKETLILYTDGIVEARDPKGDQMFGLQRLKAAVGGPRAALALMACAEEARNTLEEFTGSTELQDDFTIFLLRRM